MTYPNRTPPNATNKPMMMAGAAEPAASSGFLIAKPIVRLLCEELRIGVIGVGVGLAVGNLS